MEKRSSDCKDQLIGISYTGEKDKAIKLKKMIQEIKTASLKI